MIMKLGYFPPAVTVVFGIILLSLAQSRTLSIQTNITDQLSINSSSSSSSSLTLPLTLVPNTDITNVTGVLNASTGLSFPIPLNQRIAGLIASIYTDYEGSEVWDIAYAGPHDDTVYGYALLRIHFRLPDGLTYVRVMDIRRPIWSVGPVTLANPQPQYGPQRRKLKWIEVHLNVNEALWFLRSAGYHDRVAYVWITAWNSAPPRVASLPPYYIFVFRDVIGPRKNVTVDAVNGRVRLWDVSS